MRDMLRNARIRNVENNELHVVAYKLRNGKMVYGNQWGPLHIERLFTYGKKSWNSFKGNSLPDNS